MTVGHSSSLVITPQHRSAAALTARQALGLGGSTFRNIAQDRDVCAASALPAQDGFGWTKGVMLKLTALYPADADLESADLCPAGHGS